MNEIFQSEMCSISSSTHVIPLMMNSFKSSHIKQYTLMIYFLSLIFIVETMSEAVKILKGEYVIQALEEHKMDKALIFCRTKLDCDNLEKYLQQRGGGIHPS